MIPTIHQTIEQIIRSSTPEQRILWNEARLIVGENAAIQPYYFLGSTAGHRMLTTNAEVLYFAYELEFSKNTFAATTSAAGVNLFNPVGGTIFMPSQPFPVWDVTGAAIKYTSNTIQLKNLLLWGFLPVSIDYFKFIGYILTY
jgi:bifunctional ADP-heptose synthase (sugar kinase/adenylyltransferase)